MTQATIEEPQDTQPTPSRWEDFVDILYAPTAVFERRRGAGFGWMLVGLTVLLALLLFGTMTVLGPVYQAEMMRNMDPAAQGAVDPAQLMRWGTIAGVIGFALFFPISVLFIGLLLWGGSRVFGSAMAFGSAALVATYSQVPMVFQQVAAILQGLLMDVREMDSMRDVSLSVARFLPDTTSPVVLALANRLEPFSLWVLALMVIGVSVLGKLPRGQAFAIAFVAWLISALPELIGAIAQGG